MTATALREQRDRAVGVAVIGAAWAIAAYLVLHYGALALLGWQGLHELLGQDLYNALVPAGGFLLLAYGALQLVLWTAPFAIFAAFVAGVLRFALPRTNNRVRRRWAMGAALAGTLALPPVFLDGYPATLWPVVAGDDTSYAPGYSAWRFRSLREGMTQDDALALLGEPLRRFDAGAGEQHWHWTVSPQGSHYRVRRAHFIDGRLRSKHAEVWFD